jgi:hypothetical protein
VDIRAPSLVNNFVRLLTKTNLLGFENSAQLFCDLRLFLREMRREAEILEASAVSTANGE